MVEEAQLHAEAALAAQETRHETTLENLQVGTLSMSQQTLVIRLCCQQDVGCTFLPVLCTQ